MRHFRFTAPALKSAVFIVALGSIAALGISNVGVLAQSLYDTNMDGTNSNYSNPSEPSVQPSDPSMQAGNVSAPKKMIFLFNPEYPPSAIAVAPVNPVNKTNFWKLLDKEFQNTQTLALTENIEDADYRVKLECAGITTCTKLRVFVETPKRDVLAGYTIEKISGPFGLSRKPLSEVAKTLSGTLEERLNQLEQGDYGYSHY